MWSSASDDYVEAIVNCIFPKNVKLEFIWGRSKCTYACDPSAIDALDYIYYLNHYNYVKVLKKVKRLGFRLRRVLIIDDTPAKVRRNFGNAIYPKEYRGELNDNELLLLSKYLKTIKDIENVRVI